MIFTPRAMARAAAYSAVFALLLSAFASASPSAGVADPSQRVSDPSQRVADTSQRVADTSRRAKDPYREDPYLKTGDSHPKAEDSYPKAGGLHPKTEDPYPKVARSYAVYADGRLLWAHKPDQRLPMASLTKIMTALMVIEHGRLNDIATISRDAAGETGTRLGVIEGERWRVIDLLASSLIMSSNDTCRAMAEHVAGSQPLFVQMMNRRAGQLGLKNTRFRNACGHDEKGHYSSARDLAALVNSALQNRVFADAVGLAGGTVATSDGVRTLTITSTNELLGRYPGAAGVKTGYTPRAGKCLIALARRSEGSVLLILLNAPDRWWKAEEILNAAFDTLKKPAPDAPQDKFQ